MWSSGGHTLHHRPFRIFVVVVLCVLMSFSGRQEYRKRFPSGGSGAWYTNAQVERLVRTHMDLQRASFLDESMLPVTFYLDLTRIKSVDSRRVNRMLNNLALEPTVRVQSMENPARVASVKRGIHDVLFIDFDSMALDDLVQQLNPLLETPTCRDCNSRLLIARTSLNATAHTALEALLDQDMRWAVALEPLAMSGNDNKGGFMFALRRQKLQIEEQRLLLDLQRDRMSDTPCSQRQYVIHTVLESGLGSALTVINEAAMYSSFHNRTLLILPNEGFAYADPRDCDRKSVDCYFHSWILQKHQCENYFIERYGELPDLPEQGAGRGRYKFTKKLRPTERSPEASFWVWEWPSFAGKDGSEYQESLRERQLTSRGALLALLLSQPKRQVREPISARLQALQPRSRYISAHVRHGDKSSEVPTIPFAGYMKHVELLSRALASKTVFVSTDNQTIADADFELYPHLDMRAQDVKRFGDTKGGWWLDGSQTALDRFLDAMVDFHVLANADAFVGFYSSGFSDIVLALRGLTHRYASFTVGRMGELVAPGMAKLGFYDPFED